MFRLRNAFNSLTKYVEEFAQSFKEANERFRTNLALDYEQPVPGETPALEMKPGRKKGAKE